MVGVKLKMFGIRTFVCGIVAAIVVTSGHLKAAEEGQFEKSEIRVIRPKYFTKSGRLETGAQLTAIMNQPFIYTFLATGILDYHFTEAFAAEVQGAYGFSFDRDDKTALKKNFDITTQLLRTQYFLEGGLLYTPIYGKYQLSTGRLIYLDTFFELGGGITGVNYQYDQCPKASDDPTGRTADPPAPRTVSYPTISYGGGQRIFLDKKMSLRWDVRGHTFSYNTADGNCSASSGGASKVNTNITMQIGAGYFL